MPTDWSTTRSRHGTPSGYRLHQTLGERPCDACYRAKAEYDKNQRQIPAKAKKNRLHARAQNKAYGALARNHRAEYLVLYEAFKKQLGQEREEPRHD